MPFFSNKPLLRALALSGLIHIVLLTGVVVVLPVSPEMPVALVRVNLKGAVTANEVKADKGKPAPVVERPPSKVGETVAPLRAAETQPVIAVPSAPDVAAAEARPIASVPGAERKPALSPAREGASRSESPEARASAPEAPNADDLRQYRVSLGVAARRFKRYPPMARERGWEGTVVVTVVVHPRMPQPEVSLSRSSGWAMLDEQALEMLRRAAGATALPESLKGRGFSMELPVRFSLDEE